MHAPLKDHLAVPMPTRQDMSLALRLRLIRQAIDDLSWKHDAIARALDVEPDYLSKMLAGTKPFTMRHVDLLPDDVEKRFSRLYAESFGLPIVEPLPPHQAIGQALISIGHAMTTGAFGALPGPGQVLRMEPK